MFAFFTGRRWQRAYRALLIAVMVFNTVVPTTAIARALPAAGTEKENLQGMKGSTIGDWRYAIREHLSLQDGTPTVAPVETVTETPTPEPSVTSTAPLESIPTSIEATPTAPVFETTPIPSGTVTEAATHSVSTANQLPVLSFKFSAAPEQVAPGDEVTFTIEIANTGKTPATGLLFSNALPQDFGNAQNGFKDFDFDPQTRLLTWSSAKAGGTALAPGEKLSLSYTIRMNGQRDEVQLVDSATLNADGLTTPLVAEAALTLVTSQKRLTILNSQGGKAVGLDGHIQVNLPQDTFNTPRGLLIRDLNDGLTPSGAEEGQPFLKFALELRALKPENAQPLNVPAASNPLPADVTSTATVLPQETLPSGTAVVTEGAGLSPAGAGSGDNPDQLLGQVVAETDRIIPMEPVEAKFDQPVEIVASFGELADLSTLEADKTPFLVTLDEASGTWVRVPLKSINRETNQITAEVTHFSTWGIGIGSSFPTNGANILLFDNAYPDLFTGRTRYSLPIWTPPGRNGMAPSLALSYSSGVADGILGDVQAPWAGLGWSFGTVEIARKITNGVCGTGCGGGSYGYENKFLLLFNGTGYELLPDGTTPGRYHTKEESFLYVQLHSTNLGNNSPAATNATSEWWEVVQRDGTRWRLGWTTGSEQLGAMKGYPGAATGAWAALGYAGSATNVVASRWLADQVTDTHGNRMTFTYFEETRVVAGTSSNYDRANYLDKVVYTEHSTGTPAAGYSVVFVRQNRAGTEVPTPANDWDNWETYRLGRIDVKYGTTVIRSYDLSYQVRSYTDGGVSWQTTVLETVSISGGTPAISAPVIRFTYVDKDNRAANGASSNEWPYPRLASVANGWDGSATYTYGNDGRAYTSWYNWHTTALDVDAGPTANPMKTIFAYSTPCYNDSTAGWCNASNIGELIGYGQTTATTKDFNGTTTLAIDVHKFHTDQQKSGREYEVQRQNAAGTTLSQTSTAYTVVTTGFPTGGYFTYVSQVDEYLLATSLDRISRTEYVYDTTTGNLTTQKDYNGTPTLYRQTDYQYVTNTSPSVWILDKVARRTLTNAGGTVYAKQEYGYDGSLPASGSPTLGELTLSRQVNSTQTVDTKYLYDTYGNVTETRLFKSYGSTGSQPAGTYISYATGYDATLKTYVVSSDPPLIAATTTNYDFGLGLPTTVTDPNGNTTTTAYDGLGRVTSVTYPGFGQANVKYTYPTPPVSAPFALKMELWDQDAGVYRSLWQIMDGLGRVLQSQSPYETAGTLVLTDTSYNAQGLPLFSGLPRTDSGTGGSHVAPIWTNVPHTTSNYDALGRITSVAYPGAGSGQETYSYSGLRTTVIDRNNHQKVQESDGFGRLVKVEEYTGSSSYTLYATTTYAYDVRNLLGTVTDAASNQTTITYDNYGRKIAMSDPDMGSWSYGYGVLGTLTSQTDARTCVTTITYDDLNRPTLKSYTGPGACNPTPDVTYTYDSVVGGNEGIGRRTGMSDGSGSTTWLYNVLGQVTNETHNIESTNYSISATFDAFGRPLTQTLPSGEVLTYDYNAMGALSSLSGTNTYVSQVHYEASGQVSNQQMGNGLVQQFCYNSNTLRLTNLRVYPGAVQNCGTAASTPRLNLSYSYQANGNVSQVVDATRSETLNYTYDELDRLLSASGPYTGNYTYNAIGNLMSKGTAEIPNKVSAGQFHTCALTVSGGVMCWGRNSSGQLGDGTTTQRTLPVNVSSLTGGVAAISAGQSHTCALTTSGGALCWGKNDNGQVGNGNTTNQTSPVSVSGLTSGVSAIAAGRIHTCALLTTGAVKCWGSNSDGQLGNNSTTSSNVPVSVSGLSSGVVAITAGGWHTCALLSTGGVKCWGKNLQGQLGDNSTTQRLTPVDVSTLTSGVVAISAGTNHTCALLTTGGMKCWGSNSNGQLGDNSTTQRLTPVDVSGLTSGVASIDAGDAHTCARTTGGGMKCWGDNTDGQLGNGTNTQSLIPVNVSGLTSNVSVISAGYSHSCAVTTSSLLKCWGVNSDGQLGDGTLVSSNTPLSAIFAASSSYTYGNAAHKHAATALSTGESYTYDANGNMTSRVEGGLTYTQTFDAENRLISVAVGAQTTQFVYDGDGNLVKKINPGGSRTLYVGGIYEVDKSSGGSVTGTKTYYPAAGAMRIGSTLYYALKDHLGSASVVTDSSGNTVGEQRYYPFGETRFTTGSLFTDKLFTGQREMAGLGIYHYNARFYSPKLGRFLSADTIVPGYANPQNLNRFSYVRNNPVKYIDPTGHAACRTKAECQDMGVTPGYGLPKAPPSGGGGGGGGNGNRPHGGSVDPDFVPVPNLPPLPPTDPGNGTGNGGGNDGGGNGGGDKVLSAPYLNSYSYQNINMTHQSVEPCTIKGVRTVCYIDLEVDATASNLHHLALHYGNITTELEFAAVASAFLGPVGVVLTPYFGWEAANMNSLSDFYQNAGDVAETTESGTVQVQRFTSDQTYGVPSLAYNPQNSEGVVFTPVSPFTLIAITLLRVR